MIHQLPIATGRVVMRTDDLLKVKSAAAYPVRCLRGTVWITEEGQREDIVLTAGHDVRLKPGRLALVGALSDAELCVG